jgi:hypothetical protein
MAQRGRQKAELVLSEEERDTLARWARRPNSPQSLALVRTEPDGIRHRCACYREPSTLILVLGIRVQRHSDRESLGGAHPRSSRAPASCLASTRTMRWCYRRQEQRRTQPSWTRRPALWQKRLTV